MSDLAAASTLTSTRSATLPLVVLGDRDTGEDRDHRQIAQAAGHRICSAHLFEVDAFAPDDRMRHSPDAAHGPVPARVQIVLTALNTAATLNAALWVPYLPDLHSSAHIAALGRACARRNVPLLLGTDLTLYQLAPHPPGTQPTSSARRTQGLDSRDSWDRTA